MKLCVVTPTGKRPRMFPLCVRWVMQQHRPPDEWIISLGKDEDLGISEGLLPSYARVHRWNPDTIGQGMTGEVDGTTKYYLEVLRQAPPDHAIVWFDDDDWYGPSYLSVVERELQRVDFTGNGLERRYCLRTHRWMEIGKPGCNTGAIGMAPGTVPKWIEWAQDNTTKWDFFLQWFKIDLRNGAPRVSIKNGPTAPTWQHLFPPADHKWKKDAAPFAKLREWIGPDASLYEELMR